MAYGRVSRSPVDAGALEDPARARGAETAAITESIATPGPATLEVQRFRLVVQRGPDAGTTFVSARERAVIGTDSSCDLVLSDTTISRFHCEIAVDAGRLLLRDLDSRNGTVINGVPVARAWLPPAAIVTIGHTELRLELRSDPVRLPVSDKDHFGALLGGSVAMRRVFALLERAAESDATLLLEGETGTGKEVAAESVHLASARRDRPFLVVDCGSVPPELLESELFGHERGAYTGAAAPRQGAFELADGGTVFLDEIGELDLELQPTLLRVLERREIKRVGSSRWQKVDVRVIAATNRNLRSEVNEKRFRADLYYRVAVISVELPPLRQRLEDLPLLVDALLPSLDAAGRADVTQLRGAQFLGELARHGWPGNVRELRNYLDRCVTLRSTLPLGATDATDAPVSASAQQPRLAELDVDQPLKVARERWSRSFERQYVTALLERHDGNVAAAARAAGVNRMYFYRLLWRHGLR